jgi:flagellar biosynthetic protein FliR
MESLGLLFALVLARVGAFVAVMPLFAGQGTPRLVRAGLALALSVFWFGQLGPPAELAQLHAGPTPWLLFLLVMGREALLGAVVGLMFSLFLAPVRIAGEFITQQIGLAQAGLLGGTFSSPASPLTLILESLAGVVFLELNGHHVVLAVLHASFARYPLGGTLFPAPGDGVIQSVATAEALGVQLAGPLALAMFLVTIVLALLGRAAPQLNIYSVGFTLQSLVALGAALILLPDLVHLMSAALARMGETLRVLI